MCFYRLSLGCALVSATTLEQIFSYFFNLIIPQSLIGTLLSVNILTSHTQMFSVGIMKSFIMLRPVVHRKAVDFEGLYSCIETLYTIFSYIVFKS
jgi:hypothetical protein